MSDEMRDRVRYCFSYGLRDMLEMLHRWFYGPRP